MPVTKCKGCGKVFAYHPSELRRTYCSRECRRGPNFKKTGRGSGWKRIRSEAISSQPFCAACGTMKLLQVHHIIPWRLSRDNSQKNLVPLCRSHHKAIEHIFTQFEVDAGPVCGDDLVIWRSMFDGLIERTAFEIRRASDGC